MCIKGGSEHLPNPDNFNKTISDYNVKNNQCQGKFVCKLPQKLELSFIPFYPDYLKLTDDIYTSLLLAFLEFVGPKDKERFGEWFEINNCYVLKFLGGSERTIKKSYTLLENLNLIETEINYLRQVRILNKLKPKRFIKFDPKLKEGLEKFLLETDSEFKLEKTNFLYLTLLFQFLIDKSIYSLEQYSKDEVWLKIPNRLLSAMFMFDPKTISKYLKILEQAELIEQDFEWDRFKDQGVYRSRKIKVNSSLLLKMRKEVKVTKVQYI